MGELGTGEFDSRRDFVCGEQRSTNPEMAAPICLVVYLKPNAAQIQMSVVGRMFAIGT